MIEIETIKESWNFGCSCCGLDRTRGRVKGRCNSLLQKFPDLMINYGTRCPDHNAEVGGSNTSGHSPIWGPSEEDKEESCAVDGTLINGWTKERARDFAFAAIKLGFSGVGIYEWGFHLDEKPRKQLWSKISGEVTYFFVDAIFD
jgi:hypothetical protein